MSIQIKTEARNMTTETTPTKFESFKCFSCLEKSITTYFKLDNGKCRREDLVNKLKIILREDVTADLISNEATICRNCITKINKFYSFLETIKHSSRTYLENGKITKRRIISPTVNALDADVNEKREVKKAKTSTTTRKCLSFQTDSKNGKKLEEPDGSDAVLLTKENSPNSHNNFSRPYDHDEHSYMMYCKKEKKESSIEKIFKESHIYRQVGSRPGCNSVENENIVIDNICIENVTKSLKEGDIEKFGAIVLQNSALISSVKNQLLLSLDSQANLLCSRNVNLSSVLYKYRSTAKLLEKTPTIIQDIFIEIENRMPFLLDILGHITGMHYKQSSTAVTSVVVAYSILMKSRDLQLSAFHRLLTLNFLRGNLEERALQRTSCLSLSLSPTSKLNIQDEARHEVEDNIVQNLKENPLFKITGDNLDLRVRTGNQSSDRQHQDHHYFVSNLIFSRIAKPSMCNIPPEFNIKAIDEKNFIPYAEFQDRLLYGYTTIIGRILVQMPAFSWMKDLLPSHIHHPFSNEMSRKSKIYQMPLQFRNETKHEECVEIMDSYEHFLGGLFQKALGSKDILHKFKVPLGGDQLTRIRLQEAKNLRSLAPTVEKRFEDLHPIVIEMWHTKQDLLQKAYKELYNISSLRQPGTLFFFKSRLQKSDVNGKVKGRFQQHMDLLLTIFKHLVMEQALEFFGMDTRQSEPTRNYTPPTGSTSQKKTLMWNILNGFLSFYKYCSFDLENENAQLCKATKVTYKVLGKTKDGKVMLRPEITVPAPESNHDRTTEDDKVFNYCMNLCHWAIHIEELNDTAREGDLERVIPNTMMNVPLFFSHSSQSKYCIENIDFILKTQYLLSPLQKLRVLEGCFVNKKGGKGKNVEADLAQEHSVRNQKSLIRNLMANKTEKAILRSTGAADSVADILESFDECTGLKPHSARHVHRISEKDEETVEQTLRKLRPFNKTPGRECIGYKNIKQSPFDKISKPKLKTLINKCIVKLSRGMSVQPPTHETELSSSDSDLSDQENI